LERPGLEQPFLEHSDLVQPSLEQPGLEQFILQLWGGDGQPYVQFQQNYPVSDLETTLEMAGESLKYFGTSQALDLFLNYSEYAA
jgi:hypothetical protein